MANNRNLTASQQDFLSLIDAGELPLVAAPMFLVSGVELTIACTAAGIIGSYPAANARDLDTLRDWMLATRRGVAKERPGAPWLLNLIVHSSYGRFEEELSLVAEFQPKLVSTALGSPKRVLDTVHGYGGIVMADVASPLLARKAADAGADVLVLVTQGAGGHTGAYHPFALIAEVRKFWSGPVGIAGAITTGTDIRAAQLLGADFAMAGTRFIATSESLAGHDYRELVVRSGIEDLVASKAVSGVLANWLKPSLDKAGISETDQPDAKAIDFSGNISAAQKPWKNVWSAGHGVGGIDRISSVAAVIKQLRDEYLSCMDTEYEQLESLRARLTLTRYASACVKMS